MGHENVKTNATWLRWHVKSFVQRFKALAFRLLVFFGGFFVGSGYSVFVSLLDFWLSLDNWIIDIVKV